MPKTANRVLVATARPRDDYAALQALLQADGIEVDRAENFAQVTSLVSEHRYALALVDADLPDISGAELCRRLVDRPGPTVPVIMRLAPVTTDTREFLEAGALMCLASMTSVREMYLHVRNHLRTRLESSPAPHANCRFSRLDLPQCVLDSLPDAVIITDSRHRVVDTNAAFAQVTGLDPQEALRKTVQAVFSSFRFSADIEGVLQKLAADGAWQGELISQHDDKRSQAFWLNAQTIADGDGRPGHSVFFLADIAHHKRREQRLRTLAETDALTGTANRNLFLAQLDHAIKQAEQGGDSPAILFLDLDNFKEVNDHLGHGKGDQLLRDIAGVLQESVRSNDLVARLGGDEFAVLVLDATRSALAETAQRIVKRLAFSLSGEDGYGIEVTCSIGVSVHPHDGNDAASLLKQADKAMYAAKGRGKHGYGFASEDSGTID